MMIATRQLVLYSDGDFYTMNITEDVRAVVKDCRIREGLVAVFYQHTTGAIVVAEHEAGILVDLHDVLNHISPPGRSYWHHRRGADENGVSHVRAALLNASAIVPVLDSDLMLGTYQEILVIDMDPVARPRTVIVQVIGE